MYTSKQFYNEFAKSYDDYSKTKELYLCAVEKFIKNESIVRGSLLDIGAGSGKRSLKIAKDINAKDLTLIDSSVGMISMLDKSSSVTVLVKDVSDKSFDLHYKYDVVTSLWNVIGHVPTEEKRLIFLSNIKKCVQEDGSVFLDVNNRYNISQYGFLSVLKNIFKDIFQLKDRGDYLLSLDTKKGKIKTLVHVFSPFEIERLFRVSGLRIVKREIIDYRTGKKVRSIWAGQILYKLSSK